MSLTNLFNILACLLELCIPFASAYYTHATCRLAPPSVLQGCQPERVDKCPVFNTRLTHGDQPPTMNRFGARVLTEYTETSVVVEGSMETCVPRGQMVYSVRYA
ncbi:hypothetical protein BC834DRAFT_892804 [Gloeopeniophorella convolvens]|nr:hypothetical protein BC834DRAFT_892804 [Gloeopeniophorella convolvens]